MIPPLGSLRTETRHLNLKWSMMVVDEVVRMAQLHASAGYIVRAVERDFGIQASTDEIRRICDDAGVFVRVHEKASGK